MTSFKVNTALETAYVTPMNEILVSYHYFHCHH